MSRLYLGPRRYSSVFAGPTPAAAAYFETVNIYSRPIQGPADRTNTRFRVGLKVSSAPRMSFRGTFIAISRGPFHPKVSFSPPGHVFYNLCPTPGVAAEDDDVATATPRVSSG